MRSTKVTLGGKSKIYVDYRMTMHFSPSSSVLYTKTTDTPQREQNRIIRDDLSFKLFL